MMKNGLLKHAYEFGAVNRMTRASDRMGNMAEYDYNGLGHRVGMRQGSRTEPALKEPGLEGILPETPEVWSKETEYILDLTKNYHNLLQKEENGSIQSYIWDNSVLFMEEKEESYSYLNDLQGSVMRLLSHNGQATESYRYDEFGADLLGNQGQFHPFGYTGYQRDAVAGTYYAQAREYDARAGRFTGKDVIKGSIYFPVSLNRYLYCQNQPIDYIDLNGLSREDARKYMEEYQWDEKEKRNPDYPSFRTNCANYVSQSLVAGGVDPVTYEWFCSEKVNASEIEKWVLKIGSKEHQMVGHNVYYNDTDKGHDVLLSDTWNNANAQYEYFANPGNGYSNGDAIKAGSQEEIKEILENYDIQTGDLLKKHLNPAVGNKKV